MFSVHQKSGNSLTGHFSFMSAVGDLFALPTQGCQIKFNFDSNGGVHIQLVRIEDRVFWPIQMKIETQEGTGEGGRVLIKNHGLLIWEGEVEGQWIISMLL